MSAWLTAWLGRIFKAPIAIRSNGTGLDICVLCESARKDHLSKTHPFMEDIK